MSVASIAYEDSFETFGEHAQAMIEGRAEDLVSERSRAFFWENGHLALPRIIDDGELAEVSALYDALYARANGLAEGTVSDFGGVHGAREGLEFPQIEKIGEQEPRLRETMAHAVVAAVARRLFGRRPRLLYDFGLTKMPRVTRQTPWHQDAAFLVEPSWFETLTVWMPLQPVEAANGCLWYVPGSHRLPLQPHRSPGGDGRINGLEACDVDTSRAVPCPLPAGGVAIHHFRTLHSAGGNAGDTPRRALAWGWGVRRMRPTVAEAPPWVATSEILKASQQRGPKAALRRLARPVYNATLAALGC